MVASLGYSPDQALSTMLSKFQSAAIDGPACFFKTCLLNSHWKVKCLENTQVLGWRPWPLLPAPSLPAWKISAFCHIGKTFWSDKSPDLAASMSEYKRITGLPAWIS